MPSQRRIRVFGQQREAIDLDLMVQLVIMLGRQLAQETRCDQGASPPDEANRSLPPAEPSA